jgi:hypothetical protein
MSFWSIKAGAICASLLLAGGAASAQTKGDWVLGRWQGGVYWYPAVIQNVSGEMLTLAYDDGDRETLHVSKVRPYDWAIGAKVECNFQGQGKWYPGRISSLGGDSIGVAYDDGDKERTRTGRCRSR